MDQWWQVPSLGIALVATGATGALIVAAQQTLFNAHISQARRAWLPAGMILLLLAGAFAVRAPELMAPKGAPNLEASWHILLTRQAMVDNPLPHHWLLPIVTLGAPADKGLKWGATVPTGTGDYIYTSFSGLGFAAAGGFFAITGLPASLSTLAVFNMLLQVACCVFLNVLLCRVVAASGATGELVQAAALAGIVPSVFAREPLLSQGIIYWSQSLYQLVLIGTLLALHSVLLDMRGNRNWTQWGLLALCLVGPWLEWSGFATNGGLAALLWAQGRRRLAAGVVTATVAGGLAFLLHMLCLLPLAALIKALSGRFLARMVMHDTLQSLARGYWASYGLFLPLLGLCGVLALMRHRSSLRLPLGIVPPLIVAAAAPLAENVLMLQHAVQFSFDRLKLLPLAGILIALAVAHGGRRLRIALVVMLEHFPI